MTANTSGNLWFGVSLALIGVIVGYGIAVSVNRDTKAEGNQPPQIAQQRQAQPAPSRPPPAPTAQNVPPIDPNKDHIRGDPDAVVAVIEYSDFECPFCKRHHPTMEQIMDEYGGKVSWVYRHYPLSFHPNAQISAEASECAGDQGGNDAFWKYTDLIFEKGANKNSLVAYAEEINLDANEFQSCLDSGKFTQHVNDDMAGGSKAGVSGTPGNIVYNLKTKEARLVSGAQPFANFKSIIDEMLAEDAQAKVPSPAKGKNHMIMVDVDNWSFDPSEITVNQGDKLMLHLQGNEGSHGFTIPELGINQKIDQGSMETVTVPTDKPGTYEFFCNIPCGQGHKDMRGTLVIE